MRYATAEPPPEKRSCGPARSRASRTHAAARRGLRAGVRGSAPSDQPAASSAPAAREPGRALAGRKHRPVNGPRQNRRAGRALPRAPASGRPPRAACPPHQASTHGAPRRPRTRGGHQPLSQRGEKQATYPCVQSTNGHAHLCPPPCSVGVQQPTVGLISRLSWV